MTNYMKPNISSDVHQPGDQSRRFPKEISYWHVKYDHVIRKIPLYDCWKLKPRFSKQQMIFR